MSLALPALPVVVTQFGGLSRPGAVSFETGILQEVLLRGGAARGGRQAGGQHKSGGQGMFERSLRWHRRGSTKRGKAAHSKRFAIRGPAQRAVRAQPRAEAARPMPWDLVPDANPAP